jgi:hypothetical protein
MQSAFKMTRELSRSSESARLINPMARRRAACTSSRRRAAPSFEWTHRDALGHDIAREVAWWLPSSGRRLIRGSITDITERKRRFLAAGERRVFERITGNGPGVRRRGHHGNRGKVTPEAHCIVSTSTRRPTRR